jgi:DNA-binding NarL/FixJ family response regulator
MGSKGSTCPGYPRPFIHVTIHKAIMSSQILMIKNNLAQVFQKLSEGKSSGKISEELNLSPKTVSTYKTRIYEKMNMTSLTQIWRYAREHGLIL